MSVAGFYDELAASYHLIYGGKWDEAVVRQGSSLARLIRTERPTATTVLDCTCGIGTQAIGLAHEGFRVTGSDISAASITRARAEAGRFEVAVDFTVADVRDLDPIGGQYDVVLSADNALPHLLEDAELIQALTAMRRRLRPGGLLIVTTRDYDQALADRPPTAIPVLIEGPPRRVVVRLHDWDDSTGPLYTVRFLICTEDPKGEWGIQQHQARYRAITRASLTSLVNRAGFGNVTWRSPTQAEFHQPVLTAAG